MFDHSTAAPRRSASSRANCAVRHSVATVAPTPAMIESPRPTRRSDGAAAVYQIEREGWSG